MSEKNHKLNEKELGIEQGLRTKDLKSRVINLTELKGVFEVGG